MSRTAVAVSQPQLDEALKYMVIRIAILGWNIRLDGLGKGRKEKN